MYTGTVSYSSSTLTAQPSSSNAAAYLHPDEERQLPSGFNLSDCIYDILTAGKQLTKLLKHLEASDEQVEQLYHCVKGLHSQHEDKGRVNPFWFELQLCVGRRNAGEVRLAAVAVECKCPNCHTRWL